MPLVRSGEDAYLLPGGATKDTAAEAVTWHRGRIHTPPVVYKEMMLQVMSDYAQLPDPRNMPLADIVFFYDGRRASLRKATKPQS